MFFNLISRTDKRGTALIDGIEWGGGLRELAYLERLVKGLSQEEMRLKTR